MIQEQGIIFKSKKRHFCYFSKIDNLLYYKDFIRESFHVISGREVKFVTKDPCLAHNFSPYYINGEYITLAGQDRWKMHRKWRGLSYVAFKHEFKRHFGIPYTKDEKTYMGVKERFDNTPVSHFCEGLYLVKSKDGIIICWYSIKEQIRNIFQTRE